MRLHIFIYFFYQYMYTTKCCCLICLNFSHNPKTDSNCHSFSISKTRRLCVLANTKLYHRNLLLWISMKFWILVSTTLGLFPKDPPIYPNTHTKLTKIKIRSVQTLLRITHLAHRKSYLVIICPNSHEKLTKSEIRSSSSLFEHCSESII